MTSFFKDLNLARGIILVSLVGSLVLGWMCWQRFQQVTEMNEELKLRMKPLATDLMQSAQRHTQLSRTFKDEALRGQADLETYIRKVAQQDKVDIGNVSLTNSTEPRTKGIVDKVYRIKSDDRERKFQRLRIANFLFTLEYNSRRVKVTEIKMEVAEKHPRNHEVPEDEWLFEAELTSRQRAE